MLSCGGVSNLGLASLWNPYNKMGAEGWLGGGTAEEFVPFCSLSFGVDDVNLELNRTKGAVFHPAARFYGSIQTSKHSLLRINGCG